MNDSSNTSHASTLEEIVVEWEQYKKNKSDTTGRQQIVVDCESGEILDELPIFRFGRKLRYFEIKPGKVAFDVEGPDLAVNYSNSPHPFVLTITYHAQIAPRGTYNFIRSIYETSTPVSGINSILKEAVAAFAFDRKDFVAEYKKYHSQVEALIIETGAKCGLKLTPTIKVNIIPGNPDKTREPFISYDYKVKAKTKDAQIVEIEHYLALTLTDPIKLDLSGEEDIRAWARQKLDQFTSNAIIEKNYAEVLVNMEQSIIKQPMQEASRQIGYELKQLMSVPGLGIEKFYFETASDKNSEFAEYSTKDVRLKIALNAIVNGKLNLQDNKTKAYIRPGSDIIAGMKRNVVEFIKLYLNNITPEDCFTQQYTLEESIVKMLRSKLEAAYAFRELHITIKFLENNLSRRLDLLQEKTKDVPLVGDWGERNYTLWFRVWGVTQDGWYRFRLNNYTTADDELRDIARMVKNGMESAMLRIGQQITGSLVMQEFNTVRKRVRQEFGLDIRIHDFNEGLSLDEGLHFRTRKEEIEEKFTREKLIQQGRIEQLQEYLDQKMEAIESEENDEVIKKLDEKIAAFGSNTATAKEKFLQQRTDSPLRLSDKVSGNDTPPLDTEPKE